MPLVIHLEQDSLEPKERLRGAVQWSDVIGEDLSLHLLWFTKGKGTEDVGVAGVQNFPMVASAGQQEFSFELPEGPYSFSGALLSVVWAVEAVLGKSVERKEFVCAPGRQELQLEK